jgi:drug/metabolite transporter (DMT)-like permease
MKKALSSHLKGVLLAGASALCVSMVFIISKLVQRTMDTRDFVFWWFLFASLGAVLIVLQKRKELKVYAGYIKAHYLFLVYLGIAESAGVFTFFYLVKKTNPSIIAFVGSLVPLFVAVIAFFYLGERLKKNEITGGLITIAGVLVITYVSPDFPVMFLLLAVGAFMLFSFTSVLIRKKARDVPPLLMMLVRIFFLFIIYTAYTFIHGGPRVPGVTEGLLLLGGSFSGPILGILTYYAALKYTKAATVTLIKNTQPFIVALLSAPLLSTPVAAAQWAGGTVIVLGISMLVRRNGEKKNSF